MPESRYVRPEGSTKVYKRPESAKTKTLPNEDKFVAVRFEDGTCTPIPLSHLSVDRCYAFIPNQLVGTQGRDFLRRIKYYETAPCVGLGWGLEPVTECLSHEDPIDLTLAEDLAFALLDEEQQMRVEAARKKARTLANAKDKRIVSVRGQAEHAQSGSGVNKTARVTRNPDPVGDTNATQERKYVFCVFTTKMLNIRDNTALYCVVSNQPGLIFTAILDIIL